jgi:small subunit ribosomal protein S17
MKSQKVRDLDDLELQRQLAEMEEQLFRLQVSDVDGADGRVEEAAQHAQRPRAHLHHPARAGTGAGQAQPRGSEEIRMAEQQQAHIKNEKVGEVVSTKMTKTIVVEVSRRVPHPLYKRIIGKRKKFYAHDEEGTARLGDVVRIVECRPLSKLKRWRWPK